MKKTDKILIAAVLLLLSSGCRKSPEELYQNAVEKYKSSKDLEAKIFLTQSLLQNSSFHTTSKFARQDFIEYQNCVYSIDEKKLYLENSSSFAPEGEIAFAAFSQSENLLVLSDGFSLDFKTFDDQKTINSVKVADDEVSIDGLSILEKNIFYFYKRNIFKYDFMEGKSIKLFADETFSPPFSKNIFITNIIQIGAYIGVTVGNAGSYNLSLMNSATGKIIRKNVKTASGQMKFYNNQIFYITGATGKWKIESYNLSDGNTSTLIEFKQLKDIRFSGDYIFICEDDYYYIFDMTQNLKLPVFRDIPIEDFRSTYIVLKYMDSYYFCNTDALFSNLAKIQIDIPGFLKE
ncbi:MAG: hypothetical protein JW982_07535 [Spirochaetes bacterium]|nr:hypothetical protein [Spirochaetota bacterium]